jgi:mannosylglycerate hydrolase
MHAPSRRPVIVFSHTHWDRAWYAGFEVFRHKLVQHLDEVLELLERRPDYLHYTLDGQLSPLDDYLEIRPQQRERIAVQTRSGRLEIGPWYVQPDCFLPSGEALVRNLLLGRRLAEPFGEAMRVGYVPDSFGFPSQIPTILAGFGIDSFVYSRGAPPEVDRLGCIYRWRGEGTAAVTCVWMPQGYGHGAGLGYRAWWGDPRRQDFHPEVGAERVRDNVARMEAYGARVYVVPNGVDHSPIEPGIPAVVAKANELMSGHEVRHGRLRDFIDAIHAGGETLGEYRGEQVSAAKGMTLQGVHSARLYLKQQNQHAEALLERWAEPLAALSRRLSSGPDESDTIRHAWKLVLQNHPHDDICGCSVDAVHRENECRSAAAADVAAVIRRESAIRLGHAIDFTGQEGVPVVVYNPHGFAVRGPVDLEVELEPHQHPERPFTLRDGDGRELAFVAESRGYRDDCWLRGVPWKRTTFSATVAVDLPPCGWTTCFVRTDRRPGASAPRVRAEGRTLESDLYRIDLQADGSFDLTVKPGGRVMRGLHVFEDAGDRGDEYDFSPTVEPAVTSRGLVADIRCEADALTATATVRLALEVADGLSEDRTRRSGRRVRLELVTTIRIRAGSPRIELCTRCDHQVRDHRLRVLLPTGIPGDKHWAEEAFAVVERPDRIEPGSGWAAMPTPTRHHKSFVAVESAGTGVLLANRGLTEYEVTPERAIALTLVRAVGWLSRSDLATRAGACGPMLATPDAQCRRELVWEYALVPYGGDWRTSGAWREAHAFATPPWAFRGDLALETDSRHFDDAALSASIRYDAPPRGGALAARASMITVHGDGVVLSALKSSEQGDALVARFYSIAGTSVTASVQLGFPVRRVRRADLAERPAETVALEGGGFSFTIAHGDVATFLME